MRDRTTLLRELALLGAALAVSGCAGTDRPRTDLASHVLPPPESRPLTPASGRQPGASTDWVRQVRADDPAPQTTAKDPESAPSAPPTPPAADGACAPAALALPDAITLAFRLQPRLRAFLEGVVQARGAETIAFAPFLPLAVAAYTVGGFDLNAGGAGVPVGAGVPNFTFLPFTGAIPVGLDLHTGYELAELRVQWLLTDFGRRIGRYRQAQIATDIAQLQTDRAYQTVASDVAVAYYQVLRTRSLKRTAEEAVRRAEDDLAVAKKLATGGVIEREKVLRVEVALAQAQRALDAAEAAVAVAVAGLNLAIGLNTCAPTEVLDPPDLPEFGLCLADCLAQAVSGRRELEVAQRTVQAAEVGSGVARAGFRPRVVAEGLLTDFQQSAPRGHADLALGFIKLEWGLFEGGRRVGELRVADSKVREAAARAEALADTIAFQVTEAYRQLVVARRGIDRSRPAVEQAREAYRLARARAARGDATPTEVTEAETALTRAEQEYQTARYDYLTALARLNFAMGLPPVPFGESGPAPPGPH
jgi:outer membrane protein TolC